MLKRKYNESKKQHYIKLNPKHRRRHLSLALLNTHKIVCVISNLSPNQFNQIFAFLTLADLIKLYEAFRSSKKTKEGAKSIVNYLAKIERQLKLSEQKEFLGYIILKKRKLTKWRIAERKTDKNDWQRINLDVERLFYKSHDQTQYMRNYLRRVIFKLCGEINRFRYVQGFHCIVKTMFENGLSEQQAYLLGGYLLRDMKLICYYQNHLEKVRELCYVMDVYVYNNLPDLHYFLKKYDLSAQCYALSWFLTLYSQQLPKPILNKLWILFLIKGWKVIIKFGISLLFVFQKEILSKNQGQLPEYLRNFQSYMTKQKQRWLWQLFNSVKVTNSTMMYLARNMKQFQFNKEISIPEIKKRKGNCTYEQFEYFQFYQFPSYYSIGICCEKIEMERRFPYCHNF